MNGLQALNTLLEHAERERDDALTYVQRCEHNVRNTQAQHQQLIEYRRDYQQRWTAQFSQEGTMEIISCYHGFVGRLSMAVDQQAQVAARAVTQLEIATSKLRDKEIRAAQPPHTIWLEPRADVVPVLHAVDVVVAAVARHVGSGGRREGRTSG